MYSHDHSLYLNGRAMEGGKSKDFWGRLPFTTFHKLLKFLWEKDHLKVNALQCHCVRTLQSAPRYVN